MPQNPPAPRNVQPKAGPEYTNVQPRLVRAFGVEWLPGQTKAIPAEYAEDIKDHVLIRGGVLVAGKAAMPAPAAPPKPGSLEDVEETKALAFVRSETDLETLAKWAASESGGPKRKPILDSISERAATLSKGGT